MNFTFEQLLFYDDVKKESLNHIRYVLGLIDQITLLIKGNNYFEEKLMENGNISLYIVCFTTNKKEINIYF